MFQKVLLILDNKKNNTNKQWDIIDSQGCNTVMKTHRANLRVEMNNQDSFIMH